MFYFCNVFQIDKKVKENPRPLSGTRTLFQMVKSGLFLDPGVQLIDQFIDIRAMNRASFFDGFADGVGAAQTMHAEFHKDTGGSRVSAQHFTQGHGFLNVH